MHNGNMFIQANCCTRLFSPLFLFLPLSLSLSLSASHSYAHALSCIGCSLAYRHIVNPKDTETLSSNQPSQNTYHKTIKDSRIFTALLYMCFWERKSCVQCMRASVKWRVPLCVVLLRTFSHNEVPYERAHIINLYLSGYRWCAEAKSSG